MWWSEYVDFVAGEKMDSDQEDDLDDLLSALEGGSDVSSLFLSQ